MTLQGSSVAIVGGGIGGLTTALAFADRGASVFVFEQASAFSEVGAGIQITPNAARALDALELSQDLARIGLASEAVEPIDGLSGKPLASFDLSTQSPRYRFVHRAALIDMFVRACLTRGIDLRTHAKVLSATPEGLLRFALAEGDPKSQRFDLIVFADGLHSIGRDQINGASEPFFTGQVAWRAIIPGTMPAKARIAMGPGKHMVVYPLGDDRINVVAIQARQHWAAEGWNHPDDPDNLRAAFSNFSPDLKDLLQKVNTTNLWGLFRHEVANTWFAGKTVLLGDAAHPTLPFLAQGANLAIEDAYVLARCCAEFGLTAGLAPYQAARSARVYKAIRAANPNATNYHLGGLRRSVSFAGLRAIGRIAPNAFINRLSWLYDHDVTI